MSTHDETAKTPQHLPDFQSREELAAFWDTHSFTEYLSDLEPARAHVSDDVTAPLTEITQVRFDKAADQRLAAYAKQHGIRKSTLLRMIALDWLRNQEHRAS
ncbi:MAG: hypothetical protein ACRDHP_11190 [Ktedonobacterales bacterium]